MPDLGHAAAHLGPREGALMSEWWTYRAENFLLFSPRVYWRMFELHNAALWPLHVLTLAAGLIIILLIAWRPGTWARWLALILAIPWIFVGWSFLWNRYATINWAAAYIAPAFFVEGALLIVRVLAQWPRLRPARACRLDRISHPCLRTRRTAVACAATGTRLGLVRGLWHRAGSDGDRDAWRSAARPRQAFASAAADPRSLVPPERHDAPDHGRPQAWAPYAALALAAAAWIWTIIRRRADIMKENRT